MFGKVARSRLLPMSVPFRFFGAAAAFQVAAWAVLLLFSEEVLPFPGGLGHVFGALHFLTLGVLAMAAIGATLQLLPVATRQPVRAVWAVKLLWWLLVPGIFMFVAGASHYRVEVMGAGALTVLAALAFYAVLLARNLKDARGMKVVVAHGWGALACLAGLGATGVLLVARFEHGLALDHAAFRGAHIALAAYGFMGLLALGLSNFLLPMLAVAPPPAPRLSLAVLAIALLSIAIAVAGFVAPAAALGLAAAGTHVYSMEKSLRARLRSPLGPAFLLIRVSWACLLASLTLAALGFPGGPLLFGALLAPGWLLTFLLGVMQRILPFLASVHASGAPGGTPLISAMTPMRLLALHRSAHLGALALLIAGLLLERPVLVAAGSASGLAGSLLFAAFFLFVVTKARHGNAYPPSQPAPA
jgi:hypothetical protein